MDSKRVAIFDFDGTLIEGDSLWPFLGYVAGWPRAITAMASAAGEFAVRYLQNKSDPTLSDARTFIKARLLQKTLAGRRLHDIESALARLTQWQRKISSTQQSLLDHAAKGHRIVIASGGLDLYLPALLKDLPQHTLICTKMEVKDGVITGAMLSGNCVRKRKAELVAAFLKAEGPFEESWGYGNYPHDLPMLELVKHRIIV